MLKFETIRQGRRYSAACITCHGVRGWAVCRHEPDGGTLLLDHAPTLAHAVATIERESEAAA